MTLHLSQLVWQLKKNTNYEVNEFKFDNKEFFVSDLEFKKEANKDYFNHTLFTSNVGNF